MARGEPRLKPFALLSWAFAPTKGELARAIATLLCVWACELATPFLLGKTVDAAVSAHRASAILAFGAVTLAVTLVLTVVHAAYLRHEAKIVSRAAFDLRRHLYGRLLEQPLEWFDSARSGEIAQQVVIDSEIIDEDAIQLCADVPFAALTILGVLTAMLWTETSLALLVLASLAATAALSQGAGRPLGATETARKRRRAVLGGALQDILGGIRLVKTFGRERLETQRLDFANRELAEADVAAGNVFARLEPLFALVKAVGFLAVVWYGAWLVFRRAITPGTLVAFIAYMELLAEPMQGAGRYFRHFVRAKTTLARLCDLLAALVPAAGHGKESVDGPLRVELRDVSYSYPGADREALAGVSLSAAPGEIVAIVGRNGAGKSTLTDILLGLRRARGGTVTIGGLPIDDWDRRALRGAMTAIPQDTELFYGTLEENIRYGAPAATADDVDAATGAAGLHALIARLPKGLQTIVDGTALSGGERQGVALARALVAKPRILVLDEASAALDADARARLARLLRQGARDRVTILVAHDAAMLAMADRAVVLDRGRILDSHSLSLSDSIPPPAASDVRRGVRSTGSGEA